MIPLFMKRGLPFWPALAAGCVLTAILYSLVVWVAPKFGVDL